MRSIYRKHSVSALFIFIFLTCICTMARARAVQAYYYQLKVYHLKTQAQVDRLDHYLQAAYIPAMHRMGIPHVGVFKPVDADTAEKKVYVFTPFATFEHMEKSTELLAKDQQYQADGKDYIDAAYNDKVYNRIETIVLRAFPKALQPTLSELTSNKTDRIYELRSYESATEKQNINKVGMFNDGDEVALFKRLGFNAIFYAEVLAGSHMPNLMYMISFDNMAEHDAHWKAFGNDPYWKTLSAKSEYQNNVNHVDAIFLHPTAYSDF